MRDEQYVEIKSKCSVKSGLNPNERGGGEDYVHIGELGLDERDGISRQILPAQRERIFEIVNGEIIEK